LVEERAQLQTAYEGERTARAIEQTEAQKQIVALTEWATSAGSYAESLVEERAQLQTAYEAERAARATEQAEAQKQITVLSSELSLFKSHWFYRYFIRKG